MENKHLKMGPLEKTKSLKVKVQAAAIAVRPNCSSASTKPSVRSPNRRLKLGVGFLASPLWYERFDTAARRSPQRPVEMCVCGVGGSEERHSQLALSQGSGMETVNQDAENGGRGKKWARGLLIESKWL